MSQAYNESMARTVALGVLLVALGLALSGAISGIAPTITPAQAQPIILTPALAIVTQQPIIIVATPTPAPIVLLEEVAPAIAQPTIPPPREEPVFQAAPSIVAPVEINPAPASPAPTVDTLNDPALNGGNVAPEGCPFPIINGVCGNGLPAPADDESFGEKDKGLFGTTRPIKDGPAGHGRIRP